MKRARLGLASAAVAALALVSACGGTAPTTAPAGSGPVSASPAPSASSSVNTPQSSTGQASTSQLSAASSTTSTGGGTATCGTGQLRVRYADDPGGGAAGHVEGTLTFTNTGSSPCALRGYPGVSYVSGGDGTQVGAAATRADGDTSTVTLAAGGTARSAVQRTSPGPYGDRCRSTPVDGLRVYPPSSTTALFAAFTTTGCANDDISLLQVQPVR